MASRKNMLARILAEAEAAGRKGIAFFWWWHKGVCDNVNRVGCIDQPTHDACLAAWQRGRAQAGIPEKNEVQNG